jgi:hypothetical protein
MNKLEVANALRTAVDEYELGDLRLSEVARCIETCCKAIAVADSTTSELLAGTFASLKARADDDEEGVSADAETEELLAMVRIAADSLYAVGDDEPKQPAA